MSHCDHSPASSSLLLFSWLVLPFRKRKNIYILLDILLCSVAECFYELCRNLTSFVGGPPDSQCDSSYIVDSKNG